MPRTPLQPDHALLCERCGYALAGLDPDDHCPECGRIVADSLHARRIGSPFQRQPSAANWLRTVVSMLLHPARTYDHLDVQPAHDRTLRTINVLIASALAVPAAINLIDPLALWLFVIGGPDGWKENALAALISLPVLAVVCLTLTRTEQAGIALFGPRRGWRITKPLARSICAHASVGWIAGSAAASLGFAAGYGLERLAIHTSTGALNDAFLLAPYAFAAFGLVGGMFAFEGLVFLGMLRCKHANPGSLAPTDGSAEQGQSPSVHPSGEDLHTGDSNPLPAAP